MPAPQYLLDTNILIHLLRDDELGRFANAKYQLVSETYRPFISIVTRAELKSFQRRLNWGASRIATLDSLLDNLVVVDIGDPSILESYAEVDAASIANHGKRMGKNDLWIAATARVTTATLITTDPDFNHLDPDFIQHIRIDPEQFKIKPIHDR